MEDQGASLGAAQGVWQAQGAPERWDQALQQLHGNWRAARAAPANHPEPGIPVWNNKHNIQYVQNQPATMQRDSRLQAAHQGVGALLQALPRLGAAHLLLLELCSLCTDLLVTCLFPPADVPTPQGGGQRVPCQQRQVCMRWLTASSTLQQPTQTLAHHSRVSTAEAAHLYDSS